MHPTIRLRLKPIQSGNGQPQSALFDVVKRERGKGDFRLILVNQGNKEEYEALTEHIFPGDDYDVLNHGVLRYVGTSETAIGKVPKFEIISIRTRITFKIDEGNRDIKIGDIFQISSNDRGEFILKDIDGRLKTRLSGIHDYHIHNLRETLGSFIKLAGHASCHPAFASFYYEVQAHLP